MTSQIAPLTFDVHLTDELPVATDDLPPGQQQVLFPPISSTLISGEREAVLADAVMTIDQARGLADWIAASGKHLTTVYITHGHGDHWFGLGTVLERFPDARAVALPAVVEYMRQASTPQQLASWSARWPGPIPDTVAVAEPLERRTFELEGHELTAVDVGRSDTDHTSVLHVPDIGLVVAGDAAYNDVHLHLGESPTEFREQWPAALDTIESLSPTTVVAGHKRPGRADSPQIIEETRQYINAFYSTAENTKTAVQLYEQMLALYPARLNPDALWNSACALKPQ